MRYNLHIIKFISSIFSIQSFNQYHNQDTEQFPQPSSPLTPFGSQILPNTQPLVTTDLLSVTVVLPFPGCQIDGIIQYVAFCLTPFTRKNAFWIHPYCCVLVSIVHSFTLLSGILWYGCTTDCLYIYQLKDICFSFPVFSSYE